MTGGKRSIRTLGPGKFRFLVKASNNNGVWNEEGTQLEFSIAPAYYQSTWFRLACAVPLRDPQGKIVKWYGELTDIEERKRAEDERERLRRLEGCLSCYSASSLDQEIRMHAVFRLSRCEFGVFDAAVFIQPNEDSQGPLGEDTAILIAAIGVHSFERQSLEIT